MAVSFTPRPLGFGIGIVGMIAVIPTPRLPTAGAPHAGSESLDATGP